MSDLGELKVADMVEEVTKAVEKGELTRVQAEDFIQDLFWYAIDKLGIDIETELRRRIEDLEAFSSNPDDWS